MKIHGLAFSHQADGNSIQCLQVCQAYFLEHNQICRIHSIREYAIQSCCPTAYDCFTAACPQQDDFLPVIDFLEQADTIIFALPNYRAHLPSVYFQFSERLEGLDAVRQAALLAKVNLIFIGNPNTGADQALQEACFDLTAPITDHALLCLSSREFGLRSIDKNLVSHPEVVARLHKFCQEIL